MTRLISLQSVTGGWVLATCLVLGSVGALAATANQDPSLSQVYATAQAGKLEQAQTMMQQVLVAHPDSAKAHFVRAELFARQGDIAHARESLATAEKLAPGLPFANEQAVLALRNQIASSPTTGAKQAAFSGTSTPHASPATPETGSGSTWALPLLLGGGAIALGFYLFRRRQPASYQADTYFNQGGLSGPQTFGNSGAPANPQAYGYGAAPGYGQAYGANPGNGLGSRIMGGVATGLAVGAGVMAAEALARNLGGGHSASNHQADAGFTDISQPERNADMGGQNFGVSDSGSWDEGGSSLGVDDGGGDWDS